MTHILRENELEIRVDAPGQNYKFSRFDWTGQIVGLKYRGLSFATTERPDGGSVDHLGRGFCNEFGIDSALGFKDAENGGWFHKIGVGLLKKTEGPYQFHKTYEIRPARFDWATGPDRVIMSCTPESAQGYCYSLHKEISIRERGFNIRYKLENTGEKAIRTDEYAHNFMAIGGEKMGSAYRLTFPFDLRPDRFGETVNPGGKVNVGLRHVGFRDRPREQFFFSNLSGSEKVPAEWELINSNLGLGIRESGSFTTDKINLWGWSHVISPELFVQIDLEPGQAVQWERNYTIFEASDPDEQQNFRQ